MIKTTSPTSELLYIGVNWTLCGRWAAPFYEGAPGDGSNAGFEFNLHKYFWLQINSLQAPVRCISIKLKSGRQAVA